MTPPETARLIEQFMPRADYRERHETIVRAPADVVFEVAQHFDLQSISLVRVIFWLRAKLLGASRPAADLFAEGLVAETKALGWGELARIPGRQLVMGATAQPWRADVTFTAVAADQFLEFAEPDLVKIVWTLEAEPLDPARTRFRTETRIVATDEVARQKFRRYWRVFGVGIVMIRWLVLPALRREAERRTHEQRPDGDPAERSAFNRLFYRDRRPTRLGHWVSQFFCWWARLGLPPRSWVALEVRDRVSGRMRWDAVVVPTVAGRRYIVSMFGTLSDWVHNLEAAHGDAMISHGGSVRVRLVPVPPGERAPILREYVRVASSGRKHFPLDSGAPLADFAAIATHYPVYRIEALT